MKKYINGRRVSGSYRFVGDWQTKPTVPEMKAVRPNNPQPKEPDSRTAKV